MVAPIQSNPNDAARNTRHDDGQPCDHSRITKSQAGMKNVKRRHLCRPDQLPEILADQRQGAQENHRPAQVGTRDRWSEASQDERAKAEVNSGEREKRQVAD
jgi:hypothetical protein